MTNVRNYSIPYKGGRGSSLPYLAQLIMNSNVLHCLLHFSLCVSSTWADRQKESSCILLTDFSGHTVCLFRRYSQRRELFFWNTPSAIFMCDLITDEHCLPAFLEQQIMFLCPRMLSETSIRAVSLFAQEGWCLDKKVMAGYRAVCRKNTVDRTILIGELN